MNASESWEAKCNINLTSWEKSMDHLYTYFYLLLFIPGLLLNTMALWVLCRHISKKTKAVIFMINLALADLAQILSLPLRIYYYFTHTWPFGHGVCLFCFYLKYLNMYAAIMFLGCISVQRCIFLLDPFCARRWRRRYDVMISLAVWVVVGLGCSPFILMRSSNGGSSSISVQTGFNTSLSLGDAPTQHPTVYKPNVTPWSGSPGGFSRASVSNPPSNKSGCFKDLPTRHVSPAAAFAMVTFAELFGFLIPFICISYSSIRICHSLTQNQDHFQQSSSTRSRLQSVTSVDNSHPRQTASEKRRALRMVLGCSMLFLVCFAPYHINFLLYLMVKQDIVPHCGTILVVRKFHPLSLCLASMSSCLNPLLYYFLTSEFRQHLTRRTSSFSSALLSSPVTSPLNRSAPHRLTSMESSCSDREWRPSGASF